jgi:serine/threonine protein kinase
VDIKPENFMMKNINGAEKLHFIDFGVMEKVKSAMSGGQRISEKRSVVAGTPLFASLGVHRGGTPDTSDDLESMVSVVLCFVVLCSDSIRLA